MSKRLEGVTEKLLECAKEEFLTKGYENASLRVIASNAGSSKGAIYIRYPDKSALFSALVDDVANGLIELIKKINGDFSNITDDQKEASVYEHSNKGFGIVIDYLYDNFDEFKLLFTCSNDKKYNDTIHKLVEVDSSCMLKFVEAIGNDAISSGRLDTEFSHLLSQSFFTGLFEVIVHDMSKSRATRHINRLRKFYKAGWMTILYPETEKEEV